VLAPLLWLWLPESLPRVLIGKASARAMAAVRQIAPRWSPPTGAPAEAPVRHIPVVGLFQDGFAVPTLLIWVLYFMNLMVLYTLSSWLPTIISDAGMPLKTANAATSFYQLGGIAGALLFSYACDRFGSRLILPAVFIGASIFCFLIGLAGHNPALVVGAATTAGVFVIGGQGVANAFVGNFYGSHIRATGIGWALGMGRLGAIVGPFVIGTLHGAGATPQTLFELCAIPGLFAAAATWFVARNVSTAPASPVAPEGVRAEA
jgi:AAHS family 4-hydroxybenzoate transporter-like MFS transporter